MLRQRCRSSKKKLFKIYSRKWFYKFKNSEFDTEDKEHSGRAKVYEDAKLEALLDQDSCQTQEELASTLGVTQQAISQRLK